MLKKRGFTLIELLIVVAIIAILAAIAVPNFLEAQVRSKVSRVKADLRSISTALESYAVDNRKYPPDGANNGANGCPEFVGPQHLNWTITTPIAYITTVTLHDPFVDQRVVNNTDLYKEFRYLNVEHTYIDAAPSPSPDYAYRYTDILGAWAMYSSGPDKTLGPFSELTKHGVLYYCTTIYDPTNGTVSSGDILRCQKTSDNPKYL